MTGGWLSARMKDGQPVISWPADYARPDDGRHVLIRVRQPRNIKHHDKYWGLLAAIVEATGRWQTKDECHRWIKLQVGHYRQHPQPEGYILCELLPTDFAAMPQAEFTEYYALALAALAMETGIDPETLERETTE